MGPGEKAIEILAKMPEKDWAIEFGMLPQEKLMEIIRDLEALDNLLCFARGKWRNDERREKCNTLQYD